MNMPNDHDHLHPPAQAADRASRWRPAATEDARQDVSVFYGEKQALKDVSIDIYDERVTAFIGPSGCGKSTFLRCLNRMNDTIRRRASTGDIELDGEDIYESEHGRGAAARPRRHGVPEAQPVPEVDLRERRLRPAHPRPGRSQGASSTRSSSESLKRAGLWDEVKDRLHESGTALSGGQQQRLCIARAIAVDPEVILMDEPCSALDPIATAKIEELIHELRGRYAIAIVTHNMQQAARVSQRTAFFHLGELVEYGKTVGDLHQPAPAAHPGLHHRPLRLIGAGCMQQASGHTLKAFDEDIERLRALISQMGGLAEHAIGEAMRCLVQRDIEGAAQVVQDDKKLDALEIETERRAVQLIALRAPMAGDLRDVVAALKISGVVERIGDYAKNIAKRVPLLENAGKIEPMSLLPEMARIADGDGARRARRLRRARCAGGRAGVRARRGGRRLLRFDLPRPCSRT